MAGESSYRWDQNKENNVLKNPAKRIRRWNVPIRTSLMSLDSDFNPKWPMRLRDDILKFSQLSKQKNKINVANLDLPKLPNNLVS